MSLSSSPPPPLAHTGSTPAAEESPICVGQRVRFDVECVLIPDPNPVSKMPRLVTKSYSVPLWRRRALESAVSDSETDIRDDDLVILKVSVPSLVIKPRSLTRSESLRQPLTPCIVNRDAICASVPASASAGPQARRFHARSASCPRRDLVTVPLRPCCPNCFHSTDDCLQQGAHWQEKFTKGAQRKRSASLDAPSGTRLRRRLLDVMPGFDAVIAVDEVDRKCGSRASWVNIDDRDDDGVAPYLTPAERVVVTDVRMVEHECSGPVVGTRRAFPSSSPVLVSLPVVGDDALPLSVARTDFSRLQYAEVDRRHALYLDPLIFDELDLSLINSIPSLDAHISADSTVTHIPQPHSPPRSASARAPSPMSPPYTHEKFVRPAPSIGTLPSATSGRRRPYMQLLGPGSFLKVSAEILKGVSMSGGAPLSV
ncbi:uncharacterized protein FIBRA_00932 [Fibroporia radiculosa]|uniref:Uncharacterized protein n=1 Tax=Fibroporia radiculosa TaxID=599839 RepID=J4GIZ1_9APHY|nr:uncharacterized protein FIBRA_00932 [Fibroporia radiculosa]CCL98925.1 predicted protein [Fibroporia radiculosa]